MNRIIKNGLNPLYRLTTQNLCAKPSTSFARPSNILYKPTQLAWHQWQNSRMYTVPGGAPINLNVKELAKDVIVFKYENPKFFRYLNIFAGVQFVFWTCMAEFNYRGLKNTPVDETAEGFEELPFYKKWNLGTEKFKIGMSIVCCLCGKLSIDIG